jgi:hypothetical protein
MQSQRNKPDQFRIAISQIGGRHHSSPYSSYQTGQDWRLPKQTSAYEARTLNFLMV